MKTNADYQRDHRARTAARLVRMETSLRQIVERLAGNVKPLAAEIRKMAEEGLS